MEESRSAHIVLLLWKGWTNCDLCFDNCMCTVDKLQGFLEDKLAALDVVMEEDDVTVEEDKPKVQDFAVCNE